VPYQNAHFYQKIICPKLNFRAPLAGDSPLADFLDQKIKMKNNGLGSKDPNAICFLFFDLLFRSKSLISTSIMYGNINE
jgi:hypothetical protein